VRNFLVVVLFIALFNCASTNKCVKCPSPHALAGLMSFGAICGAVSLSTRDIAVKLLSFHVPNIAVMPPSLAASIVIAALAALGRITSMEALKLPRNVVKMDTEKSVWTTNVTVRFSPAFELHYSVDFVFACIRFARDLPRLYFHFPSAKRGSRIISGHVHWTSCTQNSSPHFDVLAGSYVFAARKCF